jgi:hypothetical protein
MRAFECEVVHFLVRGVSEIVLDLRSLPICCGATSRDAGMPEEIERAHGLGIFERSLGDWRVVASAWLVAIIFLVLFTLADALAAQHSSSSRAPNLAGAIIPRHDPSFPGRDEIAASDWLERVRAEAYWSW